MSESFVPLTTVITPGIVVPGSIVSITVTISGTTQEGVALAVSCNQPAFFSDLPKSVPIPIGENQATFKARVAAAASGAATVTASCNGGSASGACST